MNVIKFSHRYTKIPYTDKALLLDVFKSHYRDLSNTFIAYDTEILATHDHYLLPKTDLLILLLQADNGQVFTTTRRWTRQKERYYRSLRGQEFLIDIAAENEEK
jgi:hypothetical protein